MRGAGAFLRLHSRQITASGARAVKAVRRAVIWCRTGTVRTSTGFVGKCEVRPDRGRPSWSIATTRGWMSLRSKHRPGADGFGDHARRSDSRIGVGESRSMESFETGSAPPSTARRRNRVVRPQIENRDTAMWHGDSASQLEQLRSGIMSAPSTLRAALRHSFLRETL